MWLVAASTAASILLYNSDFDCIRRKKATTLASSLGIAQKLKKKHSFDKVLHLITNIRQLLLYTQALVTCRDQARTELVDKIGTSRGFYGFYGCK